MGFGLSRGQGEAAAVTVVAAAASLDQMDWFGVVSTLGQSDMRGLATA
jgi:hypothetical protein